MSFFSIGEMKIISPMSDSASVKRRRVMAGSSPTVNRWVSYPLQAVCYAAFIAVVGYFATSPPYTHLPEGEALDHAAQAAGTSPANLVGLLVAMGKETAGALRVTLADDGAASLVAAESADSLREITPRQLSQRIRERENQPFSVWDGKVRLSIAGYQDKIAVYEREGKWYLVEGSRLASTVIVKPVPMRKQLASLPANEHMCMQLARRVGLKAAETRLIHVPEPVLMVRRFDRIEHDDGVKRLHIVDGCQALGLAVSMKYERAYGDAKDVAHIREGVSLPKLFGLLEQSPVPAVDKRALLRWAIFQVLIGNTDAHGKNVSFYCDEQGLRLAPAYDMVCMEALDAGFPDTYAMAVGAREGVDAEVGLLLGAAGRLGIGRREDRPLDPARGRELQRGAVAEADMRVRLVAVLRG